MGLFDDFLDNIVPILTVFSPQTMILYLIWYFPDNTGPTFDRFFSTNNDFVGNLEWKMCLYIVDYVLICRIIYFRYVDTEKGIDNSPSRWFFFKRKGWLNLSSLFPAITLKSVPS